MCKTQCSTIIIECPTFQPSTAQDRIGNSVNNMLFVPTTELTFVVSCYILLCPCQPNLLHPTNTPRDARCGSFNKLINFHASPGNATPSGGHTCYNSVLTKIRRTSAALRQVADFD